MADRKYSKALDLAIDVSHEDETGVTEDDVRGWADLDLYVWLEAWGYVWIMGAWEYTGFEEE